MTLEQCYGFRECAGITRRMRHLLAEKLEELSYLKCSFQLNLEVDESANAIIKRERDHEIAGTDADLSAVEEQIKIQNSYDLEQLRLEREKEVAHLKAEVQSIKMDHLGSQIRKYGINAGRMIEHVEGGMNGAQLSESLEKSLRDNRNENLNMIFKLYKEGIMSREVAEQSFIALLGSEEGKNIAGLLEKSKAETQEETETEGRTFQWNHSDTEDGTIE